jgi:hypothetical protein
MRRSLGANRPSQYGSHAAFTRLPATLKRQPTMRSGHRNDVHDLLRRRLKSEKPGRQWRKKLDETKEKPVVKEEKKP